jgi:hypothetical protein
MDRNDLNAALKMFTAGAQVRIDMAWGKSAVVFPDRIYLQSDDLKCDATVNGQRVNRGSNAWKWA